MNAEQKLVTALYAAYKNNVTLKITATQIFRDIENETNNISALEFENESFWKNKTKEEIKEFIKDNYDLSVVYYSQFSKLDRMNYSFDLRTTDGSLVLLSAIDDEMAFDINNISKFLKEYPCDLD